MPLVDSIKLTTGNRYINIDYAVASALTNNVKAGIADVFVTYDIGTAVQKLSVETEWQDR